MWWHLALFSILHLEIKNEKLKNGSVEHLVWRQQRWQFWGETVFSWWYIGSCLSAVCLSVDAGHGTRLSADICHHLILPLWACCWRDTISSSFSNMSWRESQNLWCKVAFLNCGGVRTTEVQMHVSATQETVRKMPSSMGKEIHAEVQTAVNTMQRQWELIWL